MNSHYSYPPPWVPWGIPDNLGFSLLKAALAQTKLARGSSSLSAVPPLEGELSTMVEDRF